MSCVKKREVYNETKARCEERDIRDYFLLAAGYIELVNILLLRPLVIYADHFRNFARIIMITTKLRIQTCLRYQVLILQHF
jgi:hypothetical protein